MPIKKSELYSSLWKSCDEPRGGMDASQYKDYVLVLLFVKYVSDKYAGQKDARFDVPEGARFADMAALKGQKDIGDKPSARRTSPTRVSTWTKALPFPTSARCLFAVDRGHCPDLPSSAMATFVHSGARLP
jgi:hypothetical protein